MPGSRPGYTRWYWAACILLTLFAAMLRFNNLGENGLSYDELSLAVHSRGDIESIIEQTRYRHNAPILHPLILAGVQEIEISPFSVRFIPAVAGTLTVAALALLLPFAGIRKSTAFLAAALASVSGPAIQLAQDGARQYTLDTLLVVIILASGLMYIQGRKGWGYLFFLTLFIAPLLHYGIPFFSVAMLILVLVKRWIDTRQERVWHKAAVHAIIFAAKPAIFLVAGSILTYEITLESHRVFNGLYKPYLFSSYYQGEFSDIAALFEFVWQSLYRMMDYHIPGLPVITLAMTILSFAISKKFRGSELTILIFLAMTTAVTAAILDLYPLGGNYQTLVWSPATFLLFAHASLTLVESISQQKRASYAFQAGLAVFITMVMVVWWENAPYRDIRRSGHPDSLIATLNEVKSPGDIVVLGNYMEWTMRFYYPELPGSIEDYHDRRCNCPGDVVGLFGGDMERMWFIFHEDDKVSTNVIERISDLPGLDVRNVFDDGLQLFLVESTDIRQARQHFIDRGELPDVSPGDLAKPIIIMEPYEVYREGRYLVYLKPDADSHDACVEQDSPKFFLHVEPVNDDDLVDDAGSPFGFNNFDFFFQSRLFRTDGFCFTVVTLPEYEVQRITTGQFTWNHNNLWTRSVSFTEPDLFLADVLDGPDEPLLAHHPYEVYGRGNSLVYVNVECTDLEREPLFFLHVEPVNAGDLPEHRREWGFDNLDFSFASSATYEGERCGVARELPGWPILRVRTGQYADGDTLWTSEFDWGNGNGAAGE